MTPANVDYIVVGGGLTGCALASRLKEIGSSISVLLIEAGPDATEDPRTVTPLGGLALGQSELDWSYHTVPQKNTNNRRHYNGAGKVLGGGSVLNYGHWSRGDASDYDDWSRVVGDSRWSYDGMLPYFRKSEHHFNAETDKQQHGFAGPMHYIPVSASHPGRRYPLRDSIYAAWRELGLAHNSDANIGKVAGISEVEENWREGLRQPSYKAYSLNEVAVMTNTTAERITFTHCQDGTYAASGVRLADGTEISCSKEVILCTGTHRTPQLLMLSGVGPKEELSKHRIPLLLDQPEIGKNLFDHFALFRFWKLRNPAQAFAMGPTLASNPAFVKGMPVDWAMKEPIPGEILSIALQRDSVPEIDATAYSQPSRCHLETMIVYAPAGAEHVGLELPKDGTYISSSPMLNLPTSRGEVSLASTSISDPVVSDPNYYATATDRAALMYGARRLAQALKDTKAGKECILEEVAPPGLLELTSQSDDHIIDQRIRTVGLPHAHASGTMAMGKAVDTTLKVYGVEGLRVADASVFPVPISGHPQATLYALAEHAADIILSS